ncbi:hypothetical protein IQ06DRAFT_292126 [Phaeosphaeriaceae sp. SRC1lsM3a]|nr:hypothetical protein IQ06DRAFT_292126 [Stagonospora sp. SRC1lsM3a]
MSDEELQRGLDVIASVLDSTTPYRIIGAGALWAMGMGVRTTIDFDILVPSGAAATTK